MLLRLISVGATTADSIKPLIKFKINIKASVAKTPIGYSDVFFKRVIYTDDNSIPTNIKAIGEK